MPNQRTDTTLGPNHERRCGAYTPSLSAPSDSGSLEYRRAPKNPCESKGLTSCELL